MIPATIRFTLLITSILWLVPVAGWGQATPPVQSDSALVPLERPILVMSVQRLIATAPFDPLNRRNPPANPVTVLPTQNKARLLRNISAVMKAKGYSVEAYRLDSLSCRFSKKADAMSRDKYLLWLESPANTALKDSKIKVFVLYGNFVHFWGTPAGQESAAMTSAGEYEKKIKLLKSVLDAMPR